MRAPRIEASMTSIGCAVRSALPAEPRDHKSGDSPGTANECAPEDARLAGRMGGG